MLVCFQYCTFTQCWEFQSYDTPMQNNIGMRTSWYVFSNIVLLNTNVGISRCADIGKDHIYNIGQATIPILVFAIVIGIILGIVQQTQYCEMKLEIA